MLALGPDGKVVSERDFTSLDADGHSPPGTAAWRSRRAADGLVRVLELPDPKARAKSGWTLGTGDGPFGPYRPDRFLFQDAHASGCDVTLALAPTASSPSPRTTACSSSTAGENPLDHLRARGRRLRCRSPTAPGSSRSTADGRSRSPSGATSRRERGPDGFWDVPDGTTSSAPCRRRRDLRRLRRRHAPPATRGRSCGTATTGTWPSRLRPLQSDPKQDRYFSRKDRTATAGSTPATRRRRDAPPAASRSAAGSRPGLSSSGPTATWSPAVTDADRWGDLAFYGASTQTGRPATGSEGREPCQARGRLRLPLHLPARPDRRALAGRPRAGAGSSANVLLLASPGGTGLFEHGGTDLSGFDRGRAPLGSTPCRDQGIGTRGRSARSRSRASARRPRSSPSTATASGWGASASRPRSATTASPSTTPRPSAPTEGRTAGPTP